VTALKEGLENLDHFAWTLLEIRQIQSDCSCHASRSRNANYQQTSLTQPDGVEELQRKRGQIAKLSRLSLRLGKVRA